MTQQDDMLLVAPLLHYNLRHNIPWGYWLDRRNWNKLELVQFMNNCDFPVIDIKVEDEKEFVYVSRGENKYIWERIEFMGSGFNALFAGIFERVLKNE